MALFRSCKPLASCHRVVFYSTEMKQNHQFMKSNDSLYSRISPAGDFNVSVIPILDQWQREGNPIIIPQLFSIIKSLRKFNRHTHALELSEWILNRRNSRLLPGDVAVHLDLVSKVHGVEQAEKYFNTIPDDVKNLQVYGALLNCYARAKSVEKAEVTADKMKRMGLMTTLCYNSMLHLYKKIGDNKKLDKIYQEMIEMDVPCNKQTYYIRLSAYAAACDLKGMENFLKNMEENSSLGVEWNAYTIAAGGYIRSGLPDKAFEMLRKSEYMQGRSKGAGWKILIGMYAAIGKKDDVYRIWNSYKTSWGKVYNDGYRSMLNALVTLDDIDGAEKVLGEWEHEKLSFDLSIPNILIKAYCTKGLLVKAEAYVDRVMDMGKQPPASTWALFVTAYTKSKEMEKAVEMLKKCVAAQVKGGCKLDLDVFIACTEYLKGIGDLKMVEDIEKLFKDRICVPQTLDAESFGGELEE